ncbi:MAG TPA: hotdog domain-containing protein, partial [Gemmatales bacterium]|nr:hotdog domain-containing protein [Gemmatales bacterium]
TLTPPQPFFSGVPHIQIPQPPPKGARHEINLLGSACDLIVTVAMNKIEFHKPVLVGDVVSFRTRPVRLGRTSITMHVAVEAERGGQALDVTEAEVTMVSVVKQPDGTLKPTPIRRE